MTEREAYLAWSLVPGIGPVRMSEIENNMGSLNQAWEEFPNMRVKWPAKLMGAISEFKRKFDLEKLLEKMSKEKVDYLAWNDEEYPEKLKKIGHAPRVLYVKTKQKSLSKLWQQAWLGVVGTRKITTYGVGVTEMMVSGVVNQGVGVVSGLMYGVDETAQRCCIENGGVTIGVWAGGLDTLRAGGRFSLAREVYESDGVLLSPYYVGVKPTAATFPARNEWVAALSDAVLVIEGSAASGTLITAGFAAELGRSVLVVPGPITSDQSAAPNSLLKSGATPVASVEDVLKELPVKVRAVMAKRKLVLSATDQKVVDLLAGGAMNSDDLARVMGIRVAELMGVMTMLELNGLVMRSGEEWSVRIK